MFTIPEHTPPERPGHKRTALDPTASGRTDPKHTPLDHIVSAHIAQEQITQEPTVPEHATHDPAPSGTSGRTHRTPTGDAGRYGAHLSGADAFRVLFLLVLVSLSQTVTAQEKPATSGTEPPPKATEAIATPAGKAASQTQDKEKGSPLVEETVVTASYSFDRTDPTSGATLDQQRILEMPHFGDDPYRAFRVLPGVTAGELSARFGVRGTEYEDIYARLDGVELFAPFHLLDFEGVFSVLDAENLERIDFIPSAYTSHYGDRHGGVLDMTSVAPRRSHNRLGLSISNASAAWSGKTAERFSWLLSGRRGYIDQLIKVSETVDPDDEDDAEDDDGSPLNPKYWDSFARADLTVSSRQNLTFGALVTDDELDFGDEEVDEFVDVVTGYGNENFWLKHDLTVGSRTYVNTTLSRTSTTRTRDIAAAVDDESFGLADDRKMTATNLRQDWTRGIGWRNLASFGYEGRRFESDNSYSNTIGFSDVINDPRFVQNRRGFTNLRAEANSDYLAAWVSDRLQVGPRLTLEAGVRFDQQRREVSVAATEVFRAPRDDQFSPRLNVVFDLGSGGQLRSGWGHFYQSQRPNELDIEFGSVQLYEAEKQEHLTLGWNKRFSPHLSLRADAYLRRSDNPRPRYETLFSHTDAFTELSEDVFLVAPDSFEAKGLELFAEGSLGRKFEWSAAYTYSQAEDTLTGLQGDQITRPRFNDQPHAGNLNLVYRPSKKWALNMVWYAHTGWPTTQFTATARLPGGGVIQDLSDLDFEIGAFYGERLPTYHRLDLRLTRTVATRRGSLTFYLDVQDLYDRDNLAGIDLSEPEFVSLGDGNFRAIFPPEEQLGLLPSFGITWQF